MDKVKIIAVSGKGGVGKTSISAMIVKLLVQEKPNARVLAIDADPAVGLAVALSVDVKKTLDDIRKNFITNVEGGNKSEAIDILHDAEFEIFSSVIEKDGFAFLAVGRPETSGCYCKINSYLKDVISLMSEKFDYVVIDGEAGIEQINRRVMDKVSHLILVSDQSRKGIKVIESIKDVADELIMYDALGAIINRVKNPNNENRIMKPNVESVSLIKEDDMLNDFDIEGKSIFNLPNNSPAVLGVKDALIKLNLIERGV